MEALAGNERDFTRGGLRRAVALLAIPMMLEMAMESVFAVVDVFFVARLGVDSIATVGLTEAMLIIVFALAIGLSMAATATVARRIGEGDREGAAVAAVQVLLLGLLLSAAVSAVGLLGARRLLMLMGATPGVVAAGTGYTRCMLGGALTIVLLFLANAVFRGAGDAAIAMRALWLANAINIVLDPCLIFGLGPFPALGVTGAAVATNIGRGVGVLYVLSRLLRGRGRVAVAWRHLRVDGAVMARIGRVALGGIAQYLVETSSWLLVTRILAGFGGAVLAGYTIAIRVVVFTFLPAWGLSNAAATLVGQNLGAGRPRRAELSVWLTARYNLYFMGTAAIVLLLLPAPIVRVFTSDPAVVESGALVLRWIAACYLPLAYGLVVLAAFNGAGDTTTPTVIRLVTHWLGQLGLGWYLAHPLGLGPIGVLVAAVGADLGFGVIGIAAFRRGRWKVKAV
ncbi:MAG TPA: MATE family efflux transporter [Thermoanaerobaculia bacterium]|nr:MATE family efflux transporter [Thermoanaerobaculia bacterium]